MSRKQGARLQVGDKDSLGRTISAARVAAWKRWKSNMRRLGPEGRAKMLAHKKLGRNRKGSDLAGDAVALAGILSRMIRRELVTVLRENIG